MVHAHVVAFVMFSKQATRSQDPFQAQQYNERVGYIRPDASDNRLKERKSKGKRHGQYCCRSSPSLWQCKQP